MEIAMSNMTVVWIIIYVTAVLGSFVNPLFGTLGYLFEYYLRPKLHWWGQALPDLRWNLTISLVLVVTYFMRRGSLPNPGPAKRGPGICLVALLILQLLVWPIAANRDLSWDKTIDYSKLILFHGLAVGTIRTELAFDAFVAMHMAGAGWWGWEAYQNPKRTAGRLSNIGSGDSRGDNGTAAHLLTVLPFIAVYAAMYKRDKRLRGLAMVVAPFVINTIVLCNSRGAMLGMMVMAGVAILMAKSGHRIRIAATGVVFALAFYMLADPQFLARQQNTSIEDGSAQGRLEAWRGSLQLIADHPFGTGGQGFWELSPEYAAELVESAGEKRDPHNTIVLVASEWGLIGLSLYLSFYFTTYRLLRDVRKRAVDMLWYYRSAAVQIAMVGLFVAGLFTDRFYAEAPYWMGALAVALHRLHTHELEKRAVKDTPQAAERPIEPVPLRQAV